MEVGPRPALDDSGLSADRIGVVVQPDVAAGAVVEAGRLDDERVGVPAPDRVAKVARILIGISVRVRPARPNDASSGRETFRGAAACAGSRTAAHSSADAECRCGGERQLPAGQVLADVAVGFVSRVPFQYPLRSGLPLDVRGSAAWTSDPEPAAANAPKAKTKTRAGPFAVNASSLRPSVTGRCPETIRPSASVTRRASIMLAPFFAR